MKYLVYLLSLVFFTACSNSSNSPISDNPSPSQGSYSKGVFVVNEGNFSWGQATISFFDSKTKKVSQRIFEAENGEVLGNVAQSISLFEDEIYLVVNNSQKVEVINPTTFKRIATIDELNSPRYFLGLNSEKAYITDLYEGGIWIVDLKNNIISGKIEVDGWTEQLVKVGNDVFICNHTKGLVHVIDSETDEIKQSISVAPSPNSIQVDKNKNVWVLCAGSSDQAAQLIKINSQSLEKEANFTFRLGDIPNELIVNLTGDVLYYINGGIYQFEITASILENTPLISKGEHLFYGLGISPKENEIYTADALDYLQEGFVFRFEAETGVQIDSFQVGIIPGAFYFQE
jgi:DNA-binding beta-propeller fold protein YncE